MESEVWFVCEKPRYSRGGCYVVQSAAGRAQQQTCNPTEDNEVQLPLKEADQIRMTITDFSSSLRHFTVTVLFKVIDGDTGM